MEDNPYHYAPHQIVVNKQPTTALDPFSSDHVLEFDRDIDASLGTDHRSPDSFYPSSTIDPALLLPFATQPPPLTHSSGDTGSTSCSSWNALTSAPTSPAGDFIEDDTPSAIEHPPPSLPAHEEAALLRLAAQCFASAADAGPPFTGTQNIGMPPSVLHPSGGVPAYPFSPSHVDQEHLQQWYSGAAVAGALGHGEGMQVDGPTLLDDGSHGEREYTSNGDAYAYPIPLASLPVALPKVQSQKKKRPRPPRKNSTERKHRCPVSGCLQGLMSVHRV
ncbi:hypothetical protein BD413DRAFT_616518 [Trametes elegans]|nr:hypothetical protein BD413DRAFT_616518 [Trametes elegans]